MIEVPNTNAWLTQFVGDNWVAMYILWSTLSGMFPGSKLLKSLGESFSGIFPVFRKKEKTEK